MLYVYGKTMGWTSRIVEPIRVAGSKLKDFDQAYADRASRDMEGYSEPYRTISQTLGGAGLTDMSTHEGATALEAALEHAAIAGVRGTNLGYRYGLPAAGLTASGYALAQLTNQFGVSAADEQTPQQIQI